MNRNKINTLLKELVNEIAGCPDTAEQTEILNEVKQALHSISPFREEPVDCVLWVKKEEVHANTWNPNHVAPPEMELLYTSIKCDGYTQPVVTGRQEENGFEIVDGFHRFMVLGKHSDIYKRTHGYLPITKLDKEKSDRIASTIRHNRARGTHEVELMSNIVKELHDLGRSDAWISKHLGMDLDEILRLKQITGLAALFRNREFGSAWEDTD
mgnify:CR=1 FL=1